MSFTPYFYRVPTLLNITLLKYNKTIKKINYSKPRFQWTLVPWIEGDFDHGGNDPLKKKEKKRKEYIYIGINFRNYVL